MRRISSQLQRAAAVEPLLQRDAGDVLHHQVGQAVGLSSTAWMVTTWSWLTAAAAWASRAKRWRAVALVGQLRGQHLDRHDAVQRRVERLEHHAHAARPITSSTSYWPSRPRWPGSSAGSGSRATVLGRRGTACRIGRRVRFRPAARQRRLQGRLRHRLGRRRRCRAASATSSSPAASRFERSAGSRRSRRGAASACCSSPDRVPVQQAVQARRRGRRWQGGHDARHRFSSCLLDFEFLDCILRSRAMHAALGEVDRRRRDMPSSAATSLAAWPSTAVRQNACQVGSLELAAHLLGRPGEQPLLVLLVPASLRRRGPGCCSSRSTCAGVAAAAGWRRRRARKLCSLLRATVNSQPRNEPRCGSYSSRPAARGDGAEHVLRQVGGVGVLQPVLAGEAVDQRGVQPRRTAARPRGPGRRGGGPAGSAG